MRTWLVSYADAAYRLAQERLMDSAARYGIDRLRPWTRDALERTSFYRMHQAVLDEPRGGGYWLWKPFVITQTLKDMAPDDLLAYSDAGMEVIADVQPLFALCRERRDILIFAGHHEDLGAPGPNVCRKWTKRDCFVGMDCDEPRYHDGQMADASFLVVRNTARASALMREWLLCCAQPAILTDAPNRCGVPDLPGFIEHRHDQSVLSLLAIRDHLELFRHPSQHGNHAKAARDRQPGEWTRLPYGSHGLYENSPYGTLLHHNRGVLDEREVTLDLRRILPARRDVVFRAWTDEEILRAWKPLGYTVIDAQAEVRVGGAYRLDVAVNATAPRQRVSGTYLDVQPPSLLVYRAWEHMHVRVRFQACGNATTVSLTHDGLRSTIMRARYEQAWHHFFDILELALQAREARS